MNKGSAKEIDSTGYRIMWTSRDDQPLYQRSLYKFRLSQEHFNYCPDYCSGKLTWKPQAGKPAGISFTFVQKNLEKPNQISHFWALVRQEYTVVPWNWEIS